MAVEGLIVDAFEANVPADASAAFSTVEKGAAVLAVAAGALSPFATAGEGCAASVFAEEVAPAGALVAGVAAGLTETGLTEADLPGALLDVVGLLSAPLDVAGCRFFDFAAAAFAAGENFCFDAADFCFDVC